jgi:hypothetical protein
VQCASYTIQSLEFARRAILTSYEQGTCERDEQVGRRYGDFPGKSENVRVLYADRIFVGVCSPQPMKNTTTSIRRQDLNAALLVTVMLTLLILV